MMHDVTAEKQKVTDLSQEEQQLILLLRGIHYGELDIVVKDGRPIRAEVRHSIALKDSR